MTDTTSTSAATGTDRELKARHRAMWASGDYGLIAEEVVLPLGTVLADASGVGPGDRVLDVGAGTGNAALAAARRGATVVASDLTPELLEQGRRRADAAQLAIEWQEADAEHLPFPDASFDAVLSCIGVMFAPHHRAAADELVRVCRPGGRIGLLSWTPEGFVGQMLAAVRPFAPAPPPGAQPPPLWGREDHVRELLGDRVTGVRTARRTLTVERFAAPEDFRDMFKNAYGPTVAAYRTIAGDPERVAALDTALADVARGAGRAFGDSGHLVMDWEYLLLTARRA
ncbi:methyltransferase domain-containing protein [Modestobacter sp. NPDC049651]|uniref:class I SAM-dependent methyltransferase n=1 Tax=unclassified Modestobacter TaxID=2643866 RepID=UPI003406B614